VRCIASAAAAMAAGPLPDAMARVVCGLAALLQGTHPLPLSAPSVLLRTAAGELSNTQVFAVEMLSTVCVDPRPGGEAHTRSHGRYHRVYSLDTSDESDR
jgi:hypothetical protein